MRKRVRELNRGRRDATGLPRRAVRDRGLQRHLQRLRARSDQEIGQLSEKAFHREWDDRDPFDNDRG
jgi:hypothetical protein